MMNIITKIALTCLVVSLLIYSWMIFEEKVVEPNRDWVAFGGFFSGLAVVLSTAAVLIVEIWS